MKMPENQEIMLRMFVRRMTKYLAGQPFQPFDVEATPIKPSQVRGFEAKLDATGARKPFAGQNDEMRIFFRGAATIENYAKAAKGFDVQNDLLRAFCKLLSNGIGESTGIIMAPNKKSISALKKYWAGGSEAAGWQGQFKDLVRCTIVCYRAEDYNGMRARIETELRNDCYGGRWTCTIKVRERKDSNPDDLGYTDTNVSLGLPTTRMEMQVNIQSTLYGKMGRPAFMEEACPTGLGPDQYASMERKKQLPGGCGHVLYEVYKEFHSGKKCNMTIDQVRTLSRDYYDHLSGHRRSPNPDDIVQRLTELSKSEIWKATYEHTQRDDPRNLPAFRPGTKWKIGDRV